VFAVTALVSGVGISQAVLLFGHVERPARAAFLLFWAGVILVASGVMLLGARMSSSVFRGAVVIPPRPGETPADAEARGDAFSWAIALVATSFAGLECFAFIVWQAVEHY
jgi:hypothetical protein